MENDTILGPKGSTLASKEPTRAYEYANVIIAGTMDGTATLPQARMLYCRTPTPGNH